jgi:hypothetical protein
MEDQTGNVISILGFYLALISILGSFFYLHLGQWVKQIQTTQQKWDQYKLLDDRPDERGKKLECLFETMDERNLQPAIGFSLLTIFMFIIGVFASKLRIFIPGENSLANFLYITGYLFFIIYISTSLIYLSWGYCNVKKLLLNIKSNLKIQMKVLLKADEAGTYYEYIY